MRVARRSTVTLSALALSLLGALVLPAAPAHADDVRDKEWYLDTLGVAEAHRISQGEGVTVAVVDTGVDAGHPDLKGNVLAGADLFSGTSKGWTDRIGHGTAMAGLIAGHGHGPGNRDGILGIAPKARILPVAVKSPKSPLIAPTAVATAITWAVDNGADVVNVSLSSSYDTALNQAVEYAWTHNVLVVAGAGNKDTDLDGLVGYPAKHPGALAVTATDRDGKHSPATIVGEDINIAAPGADIISTAPGGLYRTGTGSSDATAIMSGVAALVKARYPKISVHDLYGRLIETAKDAGPKGHDEAFGWGIVDLEQALVGQPDGRASKPSPSAEADPVYEWDRPRPDRGIDWPGLARGIALLLVVLALIALGVRAIIRRRRRKRGTPPAGPDPGADGGPPAQPVGGPPAPPGDETLWRPPTD
ncbi:type VII secretion-associated serine protease mycosin [Plantactinospora sp. KBS50]|uniref:type VII secretion-associated serine protease mycosin n=1 Tax=Plantactinospora sp. KBS50 TaxID=2024580 RepID=UPI000BAAE0CF|nr:type VII secretion-associated serine protease mycosin [Plantactinospora sp. KBS50]ASW57123.1 type VII secretion-associated serine protease mycosin [Plantactinospora sp. KBS50]